MSEPGPDFRGCRSKSPLVNADSVSHLDLHLVESVGKKTAFLKHLCAVLSLENVTVHTGRAEALAREPELRDSFDLALVRGVARLSLLLEYALPFCRVGGTTVALKHGGLETELAEPNLPCRNSEEGMRECFPCRCQV